MTDKQFVHLHSHSSISNNNLFESITGIEDYIEIAKEWNVPAISISNHGTVVDWVKSKKLVEAAGLKYIHAIEAYVTDNKPDEKIRDNYHLMLIAKNWDGVKEINKLSSNSFNRDGHYYYNPRMYFEEIENTSDNIIILTACLGSPIYQNLKNGNEESLNKWMDFFAKNKHRVYLEVQPHVHEEQSMYNDFLLTTAEVNGMKIVATNDVHHLSKEHATIAKAIKASKGVDLDTDDEFEGWYKSRDEMVKTFRAQGVLSDEQIEEALDNTMEIVNQIEGFDLDTSHKYPAMFDEEKQEVGMTYVGGYRKKPFQDSVDIFRHLVVLGYIERGIDKFPPEKQKAYKARVNYELGTYIKTGSVDYMLLEWSLKKEAREFKVNPNKAIYPAYGRGSVSGSLIAYLLRITEMDSIKHNLNFERFMNEDRISLADIDSDYSSEDRYDIMYYLLSHPKLYCASIMTKGTYGTKKAVKAVGKSMGYTATETNDITKQIKANKDEVSTALYNEHKELFDTAKISEGSIDSFGRHASGILISSTPIEETVGTMMLPKWDYPVTQLTMKDLDYLNFVKLDILGLDNIELVHEAGQMAELGVLTPDSEEIIDFQDEAVWKSMRESNIGIFQFESDRAGKILKDMFSDETIAKMKEKNVDLRYIDLLSLASAAQRPAGASYVELITQGKFKDNGHEALNKFLSSSNGELVYQEQQTQFLVDFCGWSVKQADLIRRGIGKKDYKIMEEEVPKIKPSFVKTMVEEYGDDKAHAEQIADSFIQVFMDSVNYGFSINHSQSYSFLGYIATWLRHYYPHEFIAAALSVWSKGDKNNEVLKYAESKGVKVMPPKFQKSRGKYSVDKESSTVFEGTSHIKGGNINVGETLYTLKDREYTNFIDITIDILENGMISYEGKEMSIQEFYLSYTDDEMKAIDKELKKNPDLLTYTKNPLGINKTKMLGLIRLNFFDEYGQNKKIEDVYTYVSTKYKPNNKTFAGKRKKYLELLDYEKTVTDERFSIIEQCEHELFYTGRVITRSETIPAKYGFVTNIENVGKTRTTADIFLINKGMTTTIKVGSKLYRDIPFKEGDLIEVGEIKVKPKKAYENGAWVQTSEKELWVVQMKMIRRTTMPEK